MRILSTKKLETNQKQFLLNTGHTVIEADFIKTINKVFNLDQVNNYLIFTSQNAIKSILKYNWLLNKPCVCVGVKTKLTLEKNNFKVIACADHASELAEILKNNYSDKSFTYFSGNLRRDTLVLAMQSERIVFNEISVYDTVLTPHKISTTFNVILFYSPSGIESYLKENIITNEICFCIGTTTAERLKEITNQIIIAKQPTVENVIIQVINYLKKQ